MKYFLLGLSCLFFHMASAQERSYGMAASSPSEMRASVIITKIRETVTLSDAQANRLMTVTGNYWDAMEELKGDKNYEEKAAKLLFKRDEAIQKIIPESETYTAYQKQFDSILAAQRNGYGRRSK